jgi:hypothetical protein
MGKFKEEFAQKVSIENGEHQQQIADSEVGILSILV